MAVVHAPPTGSIYAPLDRKVQSEMPYKRQYVLEEVIEKLQEHV